MAGRSGARRAGEGARGRRAAAERLPWLALVAPSLVVLGACGPDRPRPASLQLLQFKQLDARGVFLNETLVFHFSEELDPASVTGASVRVSGPGGAPVAGRFDVHGDRLQFTPHPPCAPDFSDAGYVPGGAHEVLLGGFPRPDGLRAASGRPLEATLLLGFVAVEAQGREDGAEGGPPRPVFVDRTPDGAQPLQLVADRIGTTDPLLLACAEPLDPSSLWAEDFELRRYAASVGPDGTAVESLERIELRARLVRNDPSGSVVELRPVSDGRGTLRALAPGTHHLWIDPRTLRLQDFGGHPVPLPMSAPVPIRVEERREGPRVGWQHEPFLSRALRSPAAVEGVDGTAWWTEHGTVTVRLPRAAGDGSDGAVELGEVENRSDVHATRLRLPAERVCRLAGEGLVVLRAQGSLRLEGTLLRRGAGSAPPMPFRTLAPSQVPELPVPQGLDAWLEQVRSADPAWTVLVCGGDLVVDGTIDVDGPLLVAAGGWIRIAGRWAASEGWKVGHGGSLQEEPLLQTAQLRFEEPLENPLRETLTWATLSAPIRPPRGLERWRPARWGGREGSGSFRVRFLGERDRPVLGVDEIGPVDDPVLLEDCEALRVQIELDVEPGGAWDPPLVDFVELTWDEGERGLGSASLLPADDRAWTGEDRR